MRSQPHISRAVTVLAVVLLALGLAACAKQVSTSSFKGEQQQVAQTIANLQADATASEHAKICSADLAASVVTRLGGKKGCEAAIKDQLTEVDNLEVSVQSVQIAGASATAAVKSTYAGKSRPGKISLVKEGGKWKVAGTL